MIVFSLPLMVTFFALFMFLLMYLNATLFKPMLKHLDARKDELLKDQGGADGDNEMAAKLREEARAVIAKAKDEASKIKDSAVATAKDEVEKELNSLREKIAEEVAQFEKNLVEEESSLRSALLGQAPLFKERLKVKIATA